MKEHIFVHILYTYIHTYLKEGFYLEYIQDSYTSIIKTPLKMGKRFEDNFIKTIKRQIITRKDDRYY